MAKKIVGLIKLQVPAGKANPSPPIGPALGQRGLNIMEFCKAFNAQTAKMEKNVPIPVIITTYQDRSFTFEMKTPPVSYFLKKAAKLTSGSKTPGREKVGSVTKAQVKEIAEQKMKDLNAADINSAMKMIDASAVSTNTITVVIMVSLRDGQVTLFVSVRTSCKNLNGDVRAICQSDQLNARVYVVPAPAQCPCRDKKPAAVSPGRSGGTRTPNPRFWRPVL